MQSDDIIHKLKNALGEIADLGIDGEDDKVHFLRQLLSELNRCMFVRRPGEAIERLRSALYAGETEARIAWKRHTEYLAVWDDYAESVLSFYCPTAQVNDLAIRLNEVYENAEHHRAVPAVRNPNAACADLGDMTPREYAFIRMLHALQDFTQVLPPIDVTMTTRLREVFGHVPMPCDLATKEEARRFLDILGRADRNVDERVRYLRDISQVLTEIYRGDAYDIYNVCDGDARQIYDVLIGISGIASKKANMIMRDLYERGIWVYRTNLENVNIIADNRIMRIALRTGIIDHQLPRLLNDLLDQYDYQYSLCVRWTEEAFIDL